MFFRGRKRLRQQYSHLFPIDGNTGSSDAVPQAQVPPISPITDQSRHSQEGFPSSEWIGVRLSSEVMKAEEDLLDHGCYYFCNSKKFGSINVNYPIPVLVLDVLTSLTGTIFAIPVFPSSSYPTGVPIECNGKVVGWLVPRRASLVTARDCYVPSLRAATSDEFLQATTQLRSMDRSMAIGHFAKDHRTLEAIAMELLFSEKPFGEAIRRAWISK